MSPRRRLPVRVETAARRMAWSAVCVVASLAVAVAVATETTAWAQAPSASVPSSAGPDAAMSAAELDRLIAGLGRDSVDERRAAANALASLGPDAIPAITAKLAELRKGGDGGMGGAVRAVRDRGGKEGGGDLLEALVATKPDAPTLRALTVTSLLRALAHAGTTPAARQLVVLASDAGGVLRPELTRQMKQLGDRAVAALIEARRDPSSETRTWASNVLESLGKRTPGEAVQVKDNQALADVLRAYANAKDLDALPVVLSFVSSDRALVRLSAREATLAYGQDALWKLREAYSALMGDPAPDGIAATDLARKLFDAYDRFRLQDVYALLAKGLAEEKDGKLEAAIADFDEALARQPMLDRRAEMVGAYVTYGESLEGKDPPAALATLRKALRLDEAGPQSSHLRSEIETMEGDDLLAHGVADTEPFEQALALDPQNAHARVQLDRLHADTESSRGRGWRMVAAAAVLLLALGGIAAVGARRKRSATA
jgi:tetratricopeptide (TPR) repeat protein